MKFSEIKDLTQTELAAKSRDLRTEMFTLRLQQASAQLEKPARLRMLRLKQVASNQVDFELFSAAVSAINFCEACLKSHEHVVLEGGLTEDQVHDAIRIAATINAAAVALEAI